MQDNVHSIIDYLTHNRLEHALPGLLLEREFRYYWIFFLFALKTL